MVEEAVTPDRADLWRQAIKAGGRRDFDAMISVYAPDAVYVGRVATYEGAAAIRSFFEDWIGRYEDFEAELEEFADLGNGVSHAVITQEGRPAGSSGDVSWRYAAVSVWVEGLLVQTTSYADPDEARAAAERLAKERG